MNLKTRLATKPTTKLTEGDFGPKYFMVDHDKSGKQQILDAGEVSASYTWWVNQGSMNGCNYMSDDVLDSLNNLFNKCDERRVEAFFKQEPYTLPGRMSSSMPPTSITGGGVDLSGFRILDESAKSESKSTFTTYEDANDVLAKLKSKFPNQPWSVQKKAGRWYIANPDMSRSDMRRNIKALTEGATYSPDVGWIGGASDEGDHHIDSRTGRNERSASYYNNRPRGRLPSTPTTDYTVAVKIPFGRKDSFKELLKGKYRWDNNQRTWMISKTDLNDEVRDQIRNMGGEVIQESSPVPGLSAAQYAKEEGYDWLERGMKHRDRVASPRVGDTVTVGGKRGKLLSVDKRRIATGAMASFYRIKPDDGPEYSIRKGHSDVKAVFEDGSNFMPKTRGHSYRITNMSNKQQVNVQAPDADQAVMMAIKQAGATFFKFPIVIQNLDIHQMVHINSDAEYDSKILRVDQAASMELSLESATTK